MYSLKEQIDRTKFKNVAEKRLNKEFSKEKYKYFFETDDINKYVETSIEQLIKDRNLSFDRFVDLKKKKKNLTFRVKSTKNNNRFYIKVKKIKNI